MGVRLMAGRRSTLESQEISPNWQDRTGFLRQDVALTPVAGPPRPMSADWITDDLIAETRRVWSGHLGRIVSEDEAIEMLTNVRNAALAIMAARDNGAEP